MSIAAHSIVHAAGDRRGHARTPIGRTGVVRTADGAAVEVEIGDLTREGCRIEAAVDLQPDEAVTIGIAGVGTSAARAVWRNGTGYGFAFDRPLPAGAVTRAFDGVSVVELPHPLDGAVAAGAPAKWSARSRTAFLIAAVAASWAALGAALARSGA